MKKKPIIITGCILAVLVVLAAGWLLYTRPRRVSEFYKDSIQEIQSISVTYGNNGNIIHLTDEGKIKKLAELLGEIKVRRAPFKEQRTGWSYCFDIQFEGETLRILFGNIEINDKEYNIVSEYDWKVFEEQVEAILKEP